MDLTQLANLGEFIGGVAVLVTLLYLTTQVRQNTAAVRSGAAQSWAQSMNDINLLITGDADVARIFRVAGEDPESLTGDDQIRLDWMCLATCKAMESALLQAEMGNLEKETEEMIRQSIRDCFAYDFYHQWWARCPINFTPRMIRFVERECGVARGLGE